jgi:hypothetical protein
LRQIADIAQQQRRAVVLQITPETALRTIQRLDFRKELLDCRHETFVSIIAVKFFCQYRAAKYARGLFGGRAAAQLTAVRRRQ